MQITKPTKAEVTRELKDYIFITLGLISYALGWAAFLIPYQITTGGTTGIGAIIYYATGFPIQWSYFIINAVLMTFAIKILGPKFSIKTTFAIFGLTFFLWFFQLLVNGSDGVPPQLLGEGQDFMACLIGAAMCGAGLGIVFNCNGSTGGTDIIAAIIIFIIGRYIAGFIKKVAIRMMTHANYDHTVITFVSQIIYYALMAIVLLSALNKLGIPTNSFLAAFGAFGLAVGLALQGNLSNFASGLLILIFKPFRAGDWIAVGGVEGSVKGIQMLNTAITTKDNKTVFIPNSTITTSQVSNSSYQTERYITFLFDIGYNNDHHKAIDLLKQIFKEEPRVLNADDLEIGIKEFGDNSVRIAAYPKVAKADYLPVFYDVMSKVKDTFDANGIDIPYPQRVVYIQKPDESES